MRAVPITFWVFKKRVLCQSNQNIKTEIKTEFEYDLSFQSDSSINHFEKT